VTLPFDVRKCCIFQGSKILALNALFGKKSVNYSKRSLFPLRERVSSELLKADLSLSKIT